MNHKNKIQLLSLDKDDNVQQKKINSFTHTNVFDSPLIKKHTKMTVLMLMNYSEQASLN